MFLALSKTSFLTSFYVSWPSQSKDKPLELIYRDFLPPTCRESRWAPFFLSYWEFSKIYVGRPWNSLFEKNIFPWFPSYGKSCQEPSWAPLSPAIQNFLKLRMNALGMHFLIDIVFKRLLQFAENHIGCHCPLVIGSRYKFTANAFGVNFAIYTFAQYFL